jgi:hypothetical protein
MKRASIAATLIISTSLTSVMAAADSSPTPDCVPDVTISVGTLQTFASHAQLASYGFMWGVSDGDFGAIPTGGGTYDFFGTGAAASQCGTTNKSCEGAFRFSGTLDAVTGADTATALFGPGAGSGWTFDQNYASGGQPAPTCRSATARWWWPTGAAGTSRTLRSPPARPISI